MVAGLAMLRMSSRTDFVSISSHEQEVAAAVAGEELPTSPKPYSTNGSRRD